MADYQALTDHDRALIAVATRVAVRIVSVTIADKDEEKLDMEMVERLLPFVNRSQTFVGPIAGHAEEMMWAQKNFDNLSFGRSKHALKNELEKFYRFHAAQLWDRIHKNIGRSANGRSGI